MVRRPLVLSFGKRQVQISGGAASLLAEAHRKGEIGRVLDNLHGQRLERAEGRVKSKPQPSQRTPKINIEPVIQAMKFCMHNTHGQKLKLIEDAIRKSPDAAIRIQNVLYRIETKSATLSQTHIRHDAAYQTQLSEEIFALQEQVVRIAQETVKAQ